MASSLPISNYLVENRHRLESYFRPRCQESDLDDLIQEVCRIALEKADGGEIDSFEAWLYGTARHVLFGRYRTKTVESIDDSYPDRSNPVDDLEQKDLGNRIQKLIEPLDDDTQTLFREHYGERISLVELATRFQVSANTLAARLARGRAKILEQATQADREFFAEYGISSTCFNVTKLWCPRCGTHNLSVTPLGVHNRSEIACPSCSLFLAEGSIATQFAGPPKVALGRFLRFARANLHAFQANKVFRCPNCSRRGELTFDGKKRSLEFACEACPMAFSHSDWELAMTHAEAVAFWRSHKQIREERPLDGSQFQFVSLKTDCKLQFEIDAKRAIELSAN